MHRVWPVAGKSKSTLRTTGAEGSLKSMDTTPPTAEAVSSIRPQGLPKNTFSANWPIWATWTGVKT